MASMVQQLPSLPRCVLVMIFELAPRRCWCAASKSLRQQQEDQATCMPWKGPYFFQEVLHRTAGQNDIRRKEPLYGVLDAIVKHMQHPLLTERMYPRLSAQFYSSEECHGLNSSLHLDSRMDNTELASSYLIVDRHVSYVSIWYTILRPEYEVKLSRTVLQTTGEMKGWFEFEKIVLKKLPGGSAIWRRNVLPAFSKDAEALQEMFFQEQLLGPVDECFEVPLLHTLVTAMQHLPAAKFKDQDDKPVMLRKEDHQTTLFDFLGHDFIKKTKQDMEVRHVVEGLPSHCL